MSYIILMSTHLSKMPILTHTSTHHIYLISKMSIVFIQESAPFFILFYTAFFSFLFSRICHSFWLYLTLQVLVILYLSYCLNSYSSLKYMSYLKAGSILNSYVYHSKTLAPNITTGLVLTMNEQTDIFMVFKDHN